MASFEAKLEAAVITGAEVKTTDGQKLGTIRETSRKAVVVDGTGGPLALPRQMMTLHNQSVLIVRATIDQISRRSAPIQAKGNGDIGRGFDPALNCSHSCSTANPKQTQGDIR